MSASTADFGTMTAEELILTTLTSPGKFQVIGKVKHNERFGDKFAFQSVVLVKRNHTGGLKGLAHGKFCHPGYGKATEQLWSDRVLKYFEKTVINPILKCNNKSKYTAEDEAEQISNFFSEACRPGPWLPNPDQDKKLKEKYPKLCVLCNTGRNPDCDGYKYFEPRASPGAGVNSHLSAIECLNSGYGTVTYVAFDYVLEYFKNSTNIENYSLLCENGTTVPLSRNMGSEAPCAWISQPWNAIIARKDITTSLQNEMRSWKQPGTSTPISWLDNLYNILLDNSFNIDYPENPIELSDYIAEGRLINIKEVTCQKSPKWCTINKEELAKCEWLQKASITLGLQPDIICIKGESYIDCLSMIKRDLADILSIDSNLGYIARKYYDSTSLAYHETGRNYLSKVFTVIKDSQKDTISRFENLRNKNACFPEYGGISWVSFIKTAQEQGIIKKSECDYATEMVNFFAASCAPGATDPGHHPSKTADLTKLCSACRGFSPRNINELGVSNSNIDPKDECPADSTNKFYGNKGALLCLSEPDSHVAFIEGQNLEEYAKALNLNSTNYRILCKNGTLANNSGFSVDDQCALSVTVDGEVITKSENKDISNIQMYLQEIDITFGYDTISRKLINFEVFSSFNSTKNLLFKDSTTGLALSDSDNVFVKNYIELLRHTDGCMGNSGVAQMATFSLITGLLILQLFFKL